jgi:hypothetical protein
MARRKLVTAALWQRLEPLLPQFTPSPKGGRPRVDDERALNGILYVLQSGIPWEELPQELGFVLLHRAGAFLLLMIMTWRNTNEIWESVYVKDLSANTGYRLQEFAGSHRGTFCVWELVPVWHERNAWARFLASQRDQEAKLAYINDRFSGLV